MKNSLRILLFIFCLAAGRAFAGSGGDYATTSSTAGTSTDTTENILPFEFDVQVSYIGDSDVERGFRKVRDFDEEYGYARFLYTPRTKVGYLRLGVTYERYEFGLPDLALIKGNAAGEFVVGRPQLPETLQSISGVIGLDTKFSDSLLFRIEAQPGLYGGGDELDGDTFNIPIVLGGSYIVNPDLQFIFGVSINYERKYPVFPGGGVRWRFASQWVLNAALPTPRLEFEATRNLTVYGGADLKGSVFRMDDNFGEARGDERLNHALLTYTEVRTGAGVDWKMTPGLRLSLEGGYLPYREFDYHRADIRYKHDSGAPYGSVALRATF